VSSTLEGPAFLAAQIRAVERRSMTPAKEVEMPFVEPSKMKTAEPLPGWKGRFWRSDSMSFSHYDVTTGSSIHEHHHPNEEVWVVIEGRFEVSIGDETQVAGPGGVPLFHRMSRTRCVSSRVAARSSQTIRSGPTFANERPDSFSVLQPPVV